MTDTPDLRALDCLVNWAGFGHTAPFEAQPPEAIRAMLDVNVRALVELTRAFREDEGFRGRVHRQVGDRLERGVRNRPREGKEADATTTWRRSRPSQSPPALI